jgi:CheY-like chemotaxis protein
VTIRQTETATELRVRDTGIGIDANLLPYVFERFRQGDTGTMRAHGGLGLGLAIVRHLVELHGGTVQAASEGVGRGSTFTVQLPSIARRATDMSARQPVESTPVSLHGTCILVVDDDPDAREVVREMLEGAGANVATTASARDTRALIDRLHPDVLIADIGMPDEDGYSLIESVRAGERGIRLPAIALTAHARAEDVERALASGFEVHVAKPVDPSELLSTISTLLGSAA